MRSPERKWVDEAAGPVVRPYAVTGGRTEHRAGDFDLIAIVETADVPMPDSAAFGPEQERMLVLCLVPLSVAEVASEMDLAIGVVRVLLGDLLDHGLILVRQPAPVAQFPSVSVVKEVIDGIHAL